MRESCVFPRLVSLLYLLVRLFVRDGTNGKRSGEKITQRGRMWEKAAKNFWCGKLSGRAELCLGKASHVNDITTICP